MVSLARLTFGTAWLAIATAQGWGAEGPATSPATTNPSAPESLFWSPEDGAFDVSAFLATKQGFLPIAIPITEPAVGYGLALGLTFFHEPIRQVTGPDGQPRALLPDTTVVFAGGTQNGTWFGALAHLHNFMEGRVRYFGALGYGSAQLDWYGQNDAFDGRSVSYTNDIAFLYQQLTFDLGTSGFYAGPIYRLLATDSTFGSRQAESLIPGAEFQSTTSGLGVMFGYDSRDHPFMPRRGVRAEVSYTQSAEWLGGDFDYGQTHAYAIGYLPLANPLTLGLRGDLMHVDGDAPFYDLSMVSMRGIPMGRFVNDDAAVLEAELRWDFARRWSLLAFGGVGRTGDNLSDLWDADDILAGGMGFRYLIAEKFGLQMGIDIAYGDDAATVYVGVGTGWVRP